MNVIQKKKSAVDLTALAIGIVILGISVSIGAVILNKMGASQITSANSYAIVNESASVTTAGTNLAKTWVNGISTVTNSTTGGVLNAANYTVAISADTGVATLTNTTCKAVGDLCKGNWNVTYTVYNISDPRYVLPNQAATGLAEYGNWFKILVIVGIAAVVLALIFMSFGRGQESNDTGGISY